MTEKMMFDVFTVVACAYLQPRWYGERKTGEATERPTGPSLLHLGMIAGALVLVLGLQTVGGLG
jgi:hypothetical protein